MKADISLNELSSRMGISRETLVDLERGITKHIDPNQVLDLSRALMVRDITEFAYLNNLNKIPLRFKAYNVSLPKTGTTSIYGMFGRKYRTKHEFMFPQAAVKIMSHSFGKVSDNDFRHFVRYRDNLAHLEMDSTSFNHYYLDILADVYPEAKFLLFIRDCYSWMDSVFNMYIGNGTFAGSSGITEQWMKDYTEFWLGVPAHILQNPDEIRENAAHCITSMCHSWESSNSRILKSLPGERSLILKTNELSHEVESIAEFIGVSVEDLNMNRVHSYKAEKKFHILHSLDYDMVQAICDDICSDLMNEFFPGYGMDSYLAGENPTG